MRLDKITPGSFVQFDVKHSGNCRTENALFLGIFDDEDGERRARFAQTRSPREGDETPLWTFEWEAYRYNGRWSLGSSADPMTHFEVLVEMRS